jgi:hypothetical protein
MGYQGELAAVVTETDIHEETVTVEEGEPIRLFDRKRTRARKQKSTNGATPHATGEQGPTASDELRETLDEAVVEDAAVISQFVANGNGSVNGNGAHDFEAVSGSAEVVEPVSDEETEDTEAVKSSSASR